MDWCRYALRVVVLVATALAVTAAVLAVDNPDISGTSRGDSYTCLAPWDTVLNDADNFPGGEPPADGESIAARCRAAGQERFDKAVAMGWVAAALALFSAFLAAARILRRRRGQSAAGRTLTG